MTSMETARTPGSRHSLKETRSHCHRHRRSRPDIAKEQSVPKETGS